MTNNFDFKSCDLFFLKLIIFNLPVFYYLWTIYYSTFKMMFLVRSPFTRCVLRFSAGVGCRLEFLNFGIWFFSTWIWFAVMSGMNKTRKFDFIINRTHGQRLFVCAACNWRPTGLFVVQRKCRRCQSVEFETTFQNKESRLIKNTQPVADLGGALALPGPPPRDF